MDKNILILTDGHLPVPATQGGAVPTLVDSLLKVNEENKKVNFSVVSIFEESAFRCSIKYKASKFFFIKKGLVCRTIDSMINVFSNRILPKSKRRDLDILWKKIYILRIQEILQQNRYDAIVIENQGFLTRIFNDKTLLNLYRDKLFYHLHNEIPDSVSRKVVPELKYVLISNYLSQKLVSKYGVNLKKKIYILKNGIDVSYAKFRLGIEERNTMRQQLGFDKDDYIVVYVGRISKEKGIFELLKAFELNQNSRIKLLIVGSTEFGNNKHSEFENNIIELSKKLGDSVKTTGYIQHSDIWKYYQLSDLACLPSVWEEPAGLTILEALLNGLPVITTNVGGIPEYISNEYGIILERSSDLPKKIIETITECYIKKDCIRGFADVRREYVARNFSEQIFYNSFIRIINM